MQKRLGEGSVGGTQASGLDMFVLNAPMRFKLNGGRGRVVPGWRVPPFISAITKLYTLLFGRFNTQGRRWKPRVEQ